MNTDEIVLSFFIKSKVKIKNWPQESKLNKIKLQSLKVWICLSIPNKLNP